MGAQRIKRKTRDVYSDVPKAAVGLHGDPLGFGRFIRKLPNEVLQQIPLEDTPKLLMLIAAHAKLIVDGDPNEGIREDFFTRETMERIKFMLCSEHLRRVAVLRVRYPQDPFTEVAETAWWGRHPYCEALRRLPEADRKKLESFIVQTGNLGVLSGHLMLLPEEEMARVADRLEEIQKQLPEILDWIEETYRDSQNLAWQYPEMGLRPE